MKRNGKIGIFSVWKNFKFQCKIEERKISWNKEIIVYGFVGYIILD